MFADVFLSHSTADKPAVEDLARRLRDKEGIQAWLDKWNLVPGAPWQPAIEEALADSETCAVFIGPSGLSPWQTEEMRVAINRRVTDTQQRFRVIPVLLPELQGAPGPCTTCRFRPIPPLRAGRWTWNAWGSTYRCAAGWR
jgi:TIR domain